MKVFVTGAPGFIGSAVIAELISRGHTAVGLARSDSSAAKVQASGAEVLRGDIEDLASLKAGAAAADGVIHLAFIHDFSDFEKCCRVDREAITAMAEAMEGTGKPFVTASGTLMMPKGALATEDMETERGHTFALRAESEDLVKKVSAEKGIRGSVVRLSPTVHGKGDGGFVTMLGDMAKKNGFVTYVGDGKTRWPTIHRLDAAALFVSALEKGTPGAMYHGVGEQGVSFKSIAEATAKRINVPAESKTMEEAGQAVGFFAHAISVDNPTSSDKTQKVLGWTPKQPGIIADIEANYF